VSPTSIVARRRSPLIVVIAVGLLAVVTGTVLLLRPGGGSRAGAVPVVDRGRLPVVTSPAPPSVTLPPPSRAVLSAPSTVPAGSRLRLGRLGLDAVVTHVRAVDGVMQIPRDPRVVGWWSQGAAPGAAAGSAVIVGHINYAGTDGALSVLPATRPGDLVTVTENGRTLRYRVQAVRTYAKTSGIPASVFATDGAPRLVLITCGGPFDADTGNYEDNIVVYATPA
jgi:hypothetical protein